MRTLGGLFARLVDPDLLEHAARLTVRGKRRRRDVAAFLFRRETILREIGESLRRGAWRHGPFELVLVHDPKPRAIARACVPDRVVHTALALLLEEAYAGRMADADFACRAGRGTHRAILRLLELVRRHPFWLHLDIQSYFASIDLDVLRARLRRRVRDRAFLATMDVVLEAGRGLYDDPALRRFARMEPDWPPPGRGLPNGAYTSQVLAAHVLPSGLDQHVLWKLQPAGYVRYVDDLFLFGRSRAQIREARAGIADYLDSRLHLRLKHPNARVRSSRGRLGALGHAVTRAGVIPRARPAGRRGRRGGEWARGRGRAQPGAWEGAVRSVMVI